MSTSPPRKWYQAPWFWITSGCCLGCIIIPLACVAVVGTGGFLAVANSPLMNDAMKHATADPTLIAELGEPIEKRFLAGDTNLSIENRRASVEMTVGGPKGTAHLRGEATRRGGVWGYDWLEARLEDGRLVDLLTGEVKADERTFEPLPLEDQEPAEAEPSDP
jgi:hypothetical protein